MKTAVKRKGNSAGTESFEEALQYRTPMRVREIMVFPDMRGRPAFAVCPRCGITMEREYMSYCDRCGQCLNWRDFKKAAIIYPGSERSP